MPTDTEKAARVDAWARALMGTIPELELQRSFDHAFRIHTGSFPVSAYDLKDAYIVLIEIERKENQERREKIDEAMRKGEIKCGVCYDSGFRTERVNGYSTAIKCDHGNEI